MKVVSMKRFLLSIALISASAVVLASVDPQQLTIHDIVTQQKQLREQATAGKGAFKDMDKRERTALVERQDRVVNMLDGIQSLEDLPPDQRVEVFNDLEWIKGVVANAEDNRMVCEYVAVVGSHHRKSVCMTARERQEITERTQSQLGQGQGCALNDTSVCKGAVQGAPLSNGLLGAGRP